jgi:hypothetical protein
MGGISNVIPTEAEKEVWSRLGLSYQRNRLPVMQRIERSVCGCAYGGTSWATRKKWILSLKTDASTGSAPD